MSGKKKLVLLLGGFLFLVALGVSLWYLSRVNIAVLNPKGVIAAKERNLIIFAFLLAMVVVIPVYILTIVIALRYRESNHRKDYSPKLDGNRKAETVWWLIPSVIILILSVVTWRSSHQLDPFKPVYAETPPMTIQVVSLQWKWLFIYPKQNIATVNYVQFPVNTPLDFQITSDAPMNSFWIPQLGGQIYAMPGMTTEMHLMASQLGRFRGSSANLSGEGFASMDFTAKASTQSSFDDWVQLVKRSPQQMTFYTYYQLVQPSQNTPVSYYSSVNPVLFDETVAKYMAPGAGHEH